MSSEQQLLRVLTKRHTYMLIVGNVIGIGIFTTPGYIARYVSDPAILIFVWIVGGFLSFCGGITYAELSTRYPFAGGDFHYLSHAFHPLLGFLFGWSTLFVTYTGSIAVIAMGFSYYFLNFFHTELSQFVFSVPYIRLSINGAKIIAISICFIFSYMNVRGIKTSVSWQYLLTILSILVLLVYIFVGFSSPRGHWHHLIAISSSLWSLDTIKKAGVALIGVYFTYSGWTVLAYIAGEIKDYQRNIPRVTWWGVGTVTVLYVAMNVLYLYGIPLHQMVDVIDVGYKVLLVLGGQNITFLFTFMILIAALSTLNATVLSGARITYAMSQERQFFSAFSVLHSSYRTPARAIWLQFFWTVLLILSGTFNQLLTYTVFIMVSFGFLSGLSLFRLRAIEVDRTDHYWAWGYPFTPLLYLLMTFWIMANTFLDQTKETFLGVLVVGVGIPFYFYFRKTRNRYQLKRNDSDRK